MTTQLNHIDGSAAELDLPEGRITFEEYLILDVN